MTPSDPRPRRIHHLHSRLQIRVMLVLVLFELLMLGIALWLLHDALRDAIEASLYSVHLAHDRRLPMLVGVALPVFFGLSIVNLLVVLVAAQLWSHHVGRVLGAFRARLARLAALDFEAAPLAPRPQHPLLDWLELWRIREQLRLRALRDVCNALGEHGTPPTRTALTDAVRRLRSLRVAPPGPPAD